jgi:hypothetical protein
MTTGPSQGKLLYGNMSGQFADALRGPEYDKWRVAMDEEEAYEEAAIRQDREV